MPSRLRKSSMTTGEQAPLLQTVEEIKRGNEQRIVEVSDETKQGLSDYALELMAIESAINSAS